MTLFAADRRRPAIGTYHLGEGPPMIGSGLNHEVVGSMVVAAGGEQLGRLTSLYDDADTGQISFGTVGMIRRGRRRLVFVPLSDARVEPDWLTVRCGHDLARRAPSIRRGQELLAEDEPALFAHYDLPHRVARHGARRLVEHVPSQRR